MEVTQQQKNSIPFQYAYDVRDENIIVGKRIKQAVARFFSWIETADKDGYYLDHLAGMQIIDFFSEFLTHTKGPLAGFPFTLSPYQAFTFYNIFAWKNLKGNRRISTVYEKVGRKNGKTAGLSGLGLFLESFDGEQSPEIFVGATKEAQAKTLWNQAVQFIIKSQKLRTIGFKHFQREIKFPLNLGSFQFLGGDSKTLDSLNPSASFIDEYHAHKDDSVREVLESAMGARQNPLIYLITTAGTNVYSVCKAAEDVYKEILDGTKKDDHTFIMIHDIDDGDDWEIENNWEKANPNLRYNPPMLAHLRKEYKKAKNQPSKIPNFKTKYLNMWVDAPEIWIPNEIWQQNTVTDFAPFKDYEELFTSKALEFGCYSAVDLSTRKDLSSLVLVTGPDEQENQYLKSFNYCPQATIDIRSKEDGVPYRYWADSGLLTATPGNSIDYNFILDDIRTCHTLYNTLSIEFDPHNASHMQTILMDEGYKVSTFAQGIMHMSEPSKRFEKLLLDGKLKHNDNIIMAWSLSGVVIYEDPNENIKPVKGRSHKGKKRIDSIIAAIMALGSSFSEPQETNESKYNNPDEPVDFGITINNK